MEITLKIKSLENVGKPDVPKFQEIFEALISSGALSGVKGGKAIIHFDDQGIFRGVQLDYWPFRKRSNA